MYLAQKFGVPLRQSISSLSAASRSDRSLLVLQAKSHPVEFCTGDDDAEADSLDMGVECFTRDSV